MCTSYKENTVIHLYTNTQVQKAIWACKNVKFTFRQVYQKHMGNYVSNNK